MGVALGLVLVLGGICAAVITQTHPLPDGCESGWKSTHSIIVLWALTDAFITIIAIPAMYIDF